MKTIKLSLTALMLLATIVTAPTTPSVAQDKPQYSGISACNRALELIGEGKCEEAIKLLEDTKGTVDAEDLWLWWGNKGTAHRDLHQDDDAIECYAKAIELKSDCWFRMNRAILFHQLGRWHEALKDLEVEEKSVDPDPGVARLKVVIDGPFQTRWPTVWKKLEMTSPLGNYRIVSDFGVTEEEMDELEADAVLLDPEDRSDAKKLKRMLEPTEDLEVLCDLMEHVRQKYMKFVGMKEKDWPEGRVIKVFFFQTEAGFNQFSAETGGSGSEHALGFYEPNYRYMQIYSVRSGDLYYGIDEETIDTLIHEGWHQFFHVLCEQRPIWLNEGLAEFLAKFEVHKRGKDIELGTLIKERGDMYTRYERLKQIVSDKQHIPFTIYFKLDQRMWDAYHPSLTYAQSWGVAYWALKGNDKKFQKAYVKFFWGCVEGEPPDELLEEHFPEEDLKEYEKDWLKYIGGL